MPSISHHPLLALLGLQGNPGKYDYGSALAAGLGPGSDGHWPSRVPSGPAEGLILKLLGHPTMDKTLDAERELGYQVVERDGRLYSYPQLDPRLDGNFLRMFLGLR